MHTNKTEIIEKQIRNLYSIIHWTLKTILTKITKLLTIYTIKANYALNIQIQLELKAKALETEIEIKQKLNEQLQNRLNKLNRMRKQINRGDKDRHQKWKY